MKYSHNWHIDHFLINIWVWLEPFGHFLINGALVALVALWRSGGALVALVALWRSGGSGGALVALWWPW